ncbi:MAG: ABC transporter permease subunit [Peptostreptococcaceae bacterium]|nr:ABC transporter permease subunit [Peptostreptococcaceae bacterium]
MISIMKMLNKDNSNLSFYEKYIKKQFFVFVYIICIFIIWYFISNYLSNELIIPRPISVYNKLIEFIRAKDFIQICKGTYERTLISFVIAFIFAFTTSFISSKFEVFKDLINPIIVFFRSVPTMAIILLVLIWTTAYKAPIFVCFMVIYPIIYTNLLNAFYGVDDKLLDVSRVYNFNLLKKIRLIYIPSIMPSIKNTLKTSFGLNLKVMVAAEVLSQPNFAIGSSLYLQKINLDTAGVFAWIIIIVVSVYIIEKIIDKFFSIFIKIPLSKYK